MSNRPTDTAIIVPYFEHGDFVLDPLQLHFRLLKLDVRSLQHVILFTLLEVGFCDDSFELLLLFLTLYNLLLECIFLLADLVDLIIELIQLKPLIHVCIDKPLLFVSKHVVDFLFLLQQVTLLILHIIMLFFNLLCP